MRKLILAVLLLLLYSCEIDASGDLHFDPVIKIFFYIFLALFVFLIVNTIKNNPIKEINDRMLKLGINPVGLIESGSYAGGHPMIDNNITPCVIYRKDDELIIAYRRNELYLPDKKGTIPINSIKAILIDDATTIENKVTLGRIFLVGVFALAWTKKKKNELAFLTIEWFNGRFDNSTIFSFEGTNAMQAANTARNKLIRIIT